MTNGMKVFLSSVMEGFSASREAMFEKITKEIGWLCNAAGVQGGNIDFTGSSTVEQCLHAIDKSDVYVGIFWRRAGGQLWSPYNLYLTEVEYYYARNKGIPLLLYVIGEATPTLDNYRFLTRHRQLTRFLQVEISYENTVRHCSTFDEFLETLQSDLVELQESWQKNRRKEQISALLDSFHQGLPHLSSELENQGISVTSSEILSHDEDLIRGRLQQVSRCFYEGNYRSVLQYGADLMPIVDARMRDAKHRLSREWVEFLRMWTHACSFVGYVTGSFGALRSSLVYRFGGARLDDWSLFNEAASLVANMYYIKATGTPVRERRKVLLQALAFAQWTQDRARHSSSGYYRAYIYKELGDYQKALILFRKMLSSHSVQTWTSYANICAYYAHTLALQGKLNRSQETQKEAIKRADEAEAALSQNIPLTGTIQIRKKILQTRGLVEGFTPVNSELEALRSLAIRYGLGQHAATIQATLDEASTGQNGNFVKKK